MDNRLRIVIGVLSATAVIGILILIVGVDKFASAITTADPKLAFLTVLCAVGWLMSWSLTFYVVINYLGISMSYPNSFLTYGTVMFANNVTPFAHLGGEPIAAGFISKTVGERYETCLGGLSAVSVVHFVPSMLFFIVGSVYVLLTGSGVPESLDGLMFAFLLLTAGLVVAALLLKKYEELVQDKVSGLIILISKIAERIPKVPKVKPQEIRSKVRGYFSSFLNVATNRRTVFFATLFSTLGLMLQSVGLWVALMSVGVDIPIILPIIAVPIAGLASALPLPGGAGGIEAVLITIVVALSSYGIPEVTAGVVIMRGSIYWTPIIVGSLNLGLLTKD